MKTKDIYLLLIITCTLALGCSKINDSIEKENSEVVEVLKDGSLRVKLNLQSNSMDNLTVPSRAADYTTQENTVYDGWCLVFGEDDDQDKNTGTDVYTDNSPLIQKIPFVANANGDLFIVLKEYNKTAFIRIIANLTTREEDRLNSCNAWYDDNVAPEIDKSEAINQRPTSTQVKDNSIATFAVYRHESVGLDGIYNITYDGEPNTNKPNPSAVDPVSHRMPMTSVGFVMDGINAETIKNKFGSTIYMIRTYSKVDVTVDKDAGFTLSKIYMVGCAQESYLRSPILANTGTNEDEDGTELKNTPKDLGGAIDYEPLVETVTSGGKSTPIYFYPNSGGDYLTEDNKVNHNTNPQYIIIKGHASGYDTDGYYKIALKAQYPLGKDAYNYSKDDPTKWSALTYDVYRNTHFNVRLIAVDNVGYKTLADAKDPNNPANNISYSIGIESEDGRNEILLSNGTYYVELHTTRVYMAGYGTSGNNGSISFTANPNNDNKYPAIYIEGDYGVNIKKVNTSYKFYDEETEETKTITKDIGITNVTADDDGYFSNNNVHKYWYKVPALEYKTTITVNFDASYSGRIRLRIGDLLKFIPVKYDAAKISYEKTKLKIGDENNFSYEDIKFIDGYGSREIFNKNGIVAENNSTSKDVEVRAQLYPVNADGITKIYFKQSYSSDPDGRVEGDKTDGTDGNVIFLDNYTSKTKYNDVLEAMKNMLENGYTTIHFDQDYSNDLFLKDNNSIFYDLNKAIANDEIPGINKETFTYSVDMTKMDDESVNDNSEIKDFYDYYFKGNKYIKNLVLPSGIVKLSESAFEGCTNLESITIGTPSNGEKFDEIGVNAFKGCTKLKIVTIYSDENEYPSIKSGAFSNTLLSTRNRTITKSSGNAYEIVYTPK